MKHSTTQTALLLLLPSALILGGLFIGGLLFGIAQSLGLFNVVDVGGPTLAFYKDIFSSADFVRSLALTVYVAGTATTLAAFGGLALALLLRGIFRGVCLIRLVVQLPLPVPHLVAAIGVGLLLTQSGLLARLLYTLGLVTTPADMLPLIYDRAAFGIIATYVWKEIPFITLVMLAALHSTGNDLEYVARNLGASPWQAFRYVTLPLIVPALLGASTIVFAFTLGAFEVPLLLGQSYPRMLAVEAFIRFRDTDLAVRPTALALNTFLAILTGLAVPPYLWVLRRANLHNTTTSREAYRLRKHFKL